MAVDSSTYLRRRLGHFPRATFNFTQDHRPLAAESRSRSFGALFPKMAANLWRAVCESTATFSLALFTGASIFAASFPLDAGAQYVQTSPGVLQSSDLRSKIIVSYRTPGIFVLLGGPIDLQLFDPAKLEAPQASDPSAVSTDRPLHVFIGYSAEFDRYNTLFIGSTSYRIKGNFSLVAEANKQRLRITVDNNNPYLSVLYEPTDSSVSGAGLNGAQPIGAGSKDLSSILGFRGLQPVVNKVGQRYAALLEANQLSQLKGLIEPYTLVSGGLWFKNAPFTGSSVGVESEPLKNPCLLSGATFVAQSELNALKENGNRESAVKQLEGLLQKSAAKDPFKGVLLLRVDSSQIIGLDYAKERALLVRSLTRAGQNSGQSTGQTTGPTTGQSAQQNICAIEEIPLGA